jgi:predicted PurR-regulated permease PerM
MSFSAFSYRHFVLTLLLGLLLVLHVFAPKAAFELDMVLALAAVMAPAVASLSAKLGGRRGLAVSLLSIGVLVPLVLFAIFVVPSAAKSLKDMLLALKEQMPALRQFIEEWIVSLGIEGAGFDLDETFGKVWDILQKDGMGGAVAAMVGKVSFGLLLGIGQILVGGVVLAILAASWEPTVAWTRKLIHDVAPGQSARVFRIAEAAQCNGIAMVRGLGIMSLIFTASYLVILAAIGMPLGKIIVLGIMLGLLSSLPAVGGFISATLSLLIGIAHWGLWGWQTWVLYLSGIAAHFIEAKFLTPRIVGHAIDVPPFVMIGALLSGVALNGGAGVFQALMLLPILRAMVDDLKHTQEAPAQSGQPQAVPAAPMLPKTNPMSGNMSGKKGTRG